MSQHESYACFDIDNKSYLIAITTAQNLDLIYLGWDHYLERKLFSNRDEEELGDRSLMQISMFVYKTMPFV